MKFTYEGQEYYIDGYLASTLNSLIYNIKDDWDFVVLVTGDRGVRVGKSVLAMTICAYLALKIKEMGINKNPYGLDNVFFDNKVMVDKAQRLPKYSIVHYDEGREGLAANKAMKSFQQDLLDFFAECGQLNHVFVIVCPDFFELKENIAVARSECLINVYRKEITHDSPKYGPVVKFGRGHFESFNKQKKQLLYDISKSTRKRNYGLVKANFVGSFTNQYPIGEEEYKQKKADSLSRFAERHKEETIKTPKDDKLRNKLIYLKHKEGFNGPEIVRWLEKIDIGLSKRRVNEIIAKVEELEGESKQNNSDSDDSTSKSRNSAGVGDGIISINLKKRVKSDERGDAVTLGL